MINRRQFQLALTALSEAVFSSTAVKGADTSTLAEAAAARGLVFGAAVRLEHLTSETDYRDLFLRQCAQFTPEIALKWAAIEPRQGALDFTKIDQIASIATQHGKSLWGHTLLWHLSTPAWVQDALNHTADWSLISRYFASVIPRFGASIHSWDVVNEPIEAGHRMDGLRENIFLQTFGPDYIANALHEAHIFAPQAKLFINEFNLEYDNPDERARRYLLLKLLERLKQTGAPIDGLGLQSHLDLRKGTVSAADLTAFLHEIESLGLSLAVTELDMKEADYAASSEQRDALVADEVRRYLDIVLQARGVVSVSTWGLSDRHSWLQVKKDDLDRFPGAWSNGGGPGLNRGLPYDSNLQPKPFYTALNAALLRR